MLKNYFTIAWRNLLKSKTYSMINISGLAIGLASFLIILLYLNHELSYDTWNDDLKRVYKVSALSDEDILATTPAPLANFLKENASMVEEATRISPSGSFEMLLSVGDKKIFQRGGIAADSSFFKVFPYQMAQGNIATALDKPGAMVISQGVAKKLFGDDNPIGKTVKVHNAFECEITAVMLQPSKPSHLEAEIIYRSSWEESNDNWGNMSYQTYVKTQNVKSVETLERKLDQLYYDHRLKKDELSFGDFRQKGHQAGLFIDAVQNLHNFPKHGNSNFRTVSVLLVLAILLLLAGAINFSNLSIAASIRRAKEVGVRKVMGSSRKQLLWQFLCEIALQCVISLSLALVLISLILPYFNKEFNINLSFFQSEDIVTIIMQLAICLLVVIMLSGLYPAAYLSHYNPTNVLKGNYSRGKKGTVFRNILMIIQFSVSTFFIIGMLVIGRQMDYMQTKDKGFSGEQVMRIEATQKTRDADFETVRNTLLSIPGVQYVSKTTAVPGDIMVDTSAWTFKYEGNPYRMASVKVSADYFKTLDIKLSKGRTFNAGYSDQNTRTAIINETAAKKIDLKKLGNTYITFPYCDSIPVQVVGIVKDFNVSGFDNNVQPVVYTIGNRTCMYQSGGAILVKLDASGTRRSVDAIEQAWKKLEADFPIRYSFLDDNFQQLFASYMRLQKIINFFGFTAIAIAIMGLFALTTLLVRQRTKEVGIRKVLGAGVGDLGILLSKDFIHLVMIAAVIAIPIAWWATNEWLQGFAYRIVLNGWMFLLAVLAIIVIAVLTVSIQTIKAARANPVNSLRNE